MFHHTLTKLSDSQAQVSTMVSHWMDRVILVNSRVSEQTFATITHDFGDLDLNLTSEGYEELDKEDVFGDGLIAQCKRVV